MNIDEQTKITISERVRIAEELKRLIATDSGLRKDLLVKILDDVETGRLRPRQAHHALLRMVTERNREFIWESPKHSMPGLEEWLGNGAIAPRPKQTRLGIRAARHAIMTTLFGPSGTGKTTCAARAITYIASISRIKNLITIEGESLGEMSTSEMSDLIDASAHSDLMLIDDIDKAITGTNGKKASAILLILKRRMMLPFSRTIVTTNMIGNEFIDRIEKTNGSCGWAIVDRLRAGVCINFGPETSEEEDTDTDNKIREKIKKWKKSHNEQDDFDNEYGQLSWRPPL